MAHHTFYRNKFRKMSYNWILISPDLKFKDTTFFVQKKETPKFNKIKSYGNFYQDYH